MLGLAVHPKMLPSADELATLNPPWIRSILYGPEDIDVLKATGRKVHITLNNEYHGGWRAFEDACRLIADVGRGWVTGVGCGNELAGFWSVNDRDVPPEFCADLIRRASAILRPAGIPVYTDAVTGARWVEYLRRVLELAGDAVDGVDTHASYGRRPDGWGRPDWGFGTFRDMIGTIREMTDAPIICSEYGVKVGEADDGGGVAAFLRAADATCRDLGVPTAWFCLYDQQGKPDERGPSAFGLVAEDGRRRPAYRAFCEVNAAPPVVVTPPTEPIMPDPPDAKDYARPRAEAAGLHWPTYERMIQQESGWRHWSAPGVVKSSPTGSMGLSQLNSRFYAESDWRDPYRNIDKSIAIMADNLRRFGSYRKALAAFNWGPSNVAGYTKDGRVHPAWDGTREWRCPHEGAVPQCRTAQRDHYLDVILGPDWAEPVGTAPAPPPPPPSGIVYEDYRAGAAGRFAGVPKGIILHGSRSGRAGNPKDAEYRGTANWCVNNPDGLSWHCTVGEGRVAVHLDPREWGWHARAASRQYVGVEIAQATADEPVTDAQVDALADWIKSRVLPVWPSLPMYFPTHADVERSGETGARDGKTDVFPDAARSDELRGRLMARLTQAPPAEPPKPPVPAFEAVARYVTDPDGAVAVALRDRAANLRREADEIDNVLNELERNRKLIA